MSNNFVDSYIDQCVDEGISDPKVMCERALSRIEEIEKKLLEFNSLRNEQKNLKSVLKFFNHESVKKTRKKNVQVIINDNITNDNFDSSYEDTLIAICNIIKNNKTSVSKRQIMDGVGGLEKNQIVYMAIKWLCDRGILSQEVDRTLIKGPNWENRPLEKKAEAV